MRPKADLIADIDRVLSGRTRDQWLTIVELIEHLGETWNKNPAVTGRGLFRLNGLESFSHFAATMKASLYTYPHVAAALKGGRYPTRVGLRINKDCGDVIVDTWGPRQ